MNEIPRMRDLPLLNVLTLHASASVVVSTLDNEVKFDKFTFPDGTGHIKLNGYPSHVLLISAQPKDDKEFFEILLAKDAADRQGHKKVWLSIPYWLGSRQDRVCVRGEPLSTAVYARAINSCNFDEVHIWHPHSLVTPALIDRVIAHEGIGRRIIADLRPIRDNLVLVSPDAGAVKDVFGLAQYYSIPMVSADKVRDLETGKIIEFALHASEDEIKDKDVLIIDDILTNGGTFLGLLDSIIKLNPKSVSLCVTHADHKEGVENMVKDGNFDHIYISNSRSWVSSIESTEKIGISRLSLHDR